MMHMENVQHQGHRMILLHIGTILDIVVIIMMMKLSFIGYPHVTIRLNYVGGFHQIQSNI